MPHEGARIDHVYGANVNLYSGDLVATLPSSASSSFYQGGGGRGEGGGGGGGLKGQEIIYASAALCVIHDMATHKQRFFRGHNDDVTCFSVSSDGLLVASGQMGHSPEVLWWETALDPESPNWIGRGAVTVGEDDFAYEDGLIRQLPDVSLPALGLVARLGAGCFSRGVCAVNFSGDSKFICGVGCDDKHTMGIWFAATGVLLAQCPTGNGIPPQIRGIKWSPVSGQDTSFITEDHSADARPQRRGAAPPSSTDCHVICTVGHRHIKFWSFKRPDKQGMGAAVEGKGGKPGKVVGSDPVRCHRCVLFLSRSSSSPSSDQQFDILTGVDNGSVMLWRDAVCVRSANIITGGVFSLISLSPSQSQV